MQTNSSAYAFSVHVTAGFAALQAQGGATVFQVFLFVVGNALSFVLIDVLSTKGFRVRLHDEGADVVTLGGALSGVAILVGLAATWALGRLLPGGIRWVTASFVGTALFLLTLALAMDLARRISEHQPHEEEPDPSAPDQES